MGNSYVADTYIPHPEFDKENAESHIMGLDRPDFDDPSWFFDLNGNKSPKKTHWTTESDRVLFLQYNFARKRQIECHEQYQETNEERYRLAREKYYRLWRQLEEAIFNRHLPLAVRITEKMSNADYDSCMEIAFSKLFTSVRTFDLRKNIRFSTYLTVNIKRAFYRYYREKNRDQEVKEAYKSLPSNSIYEKMSVENPIKLLEELELRNLIRAILRGEIGNLTRYEIFIIMKRYWSEKKWTYMEIAKAVDYSHEWVRQKETVALTKIADLVENYLQEV